MRTSIRRAGAILAALAAITAVTAPVGASSPEPISITSQMTIPFDAPSTGFFQADPSDLICPTGTVLDLGVIGAGFQSGRGGQILVLKELTCDDGSGTIFVRLAVHFRDGGQGGVPTGSFTWVIVGGTGDYADLQGRGTGIGVSTGPNSVTDTYTGFLIG